MVSGAHSNFATPGSGRHHQPRLALLGNWVNNERTPPTLARDLGRGLDTCTCSGGHMPALNGSRPQRLRHPIPPYPGARTYPGAPS